MKAFVLFLLVLKERVIKKISAKGSTTRDSKNKCGGSYTKHGKYLEK